MSILENDQGFSSIKFHGKAEQPFSWKLLIDWAQRLPTNSTGEKIVIDLAGGQGYEALALQKAGIHAFVQDASSDMVKQTVVPGCSRKGSVTVLPEKDEQISGLILKDALLFLSPIQRKAMFTEARRVLVPGGQFIVLSEINKEDKVVKHKVGFADQYIIRATNISLEDWITKLEQGSAVGEFALGERDFICDPDILAQQAKAQGLILVEFQKVSAYDSLGLENRWRPASLDHFVQVFEKRKK